MKNENSSYLIKKQLQIFGKTNLYFEYQKENLFNRPPQSFQSSPFINTDFTTNLYAMISGVHYQQKIIRQKSLNEKIQIKSQKQQESLADLTIAQKLRTKARVQRERPVIKEHLKKLGGVKMNEIKKDETDNQSSEIFSKTYGRVKTGIKSSQQYYNKVNSNGFSRCPPFTQLLPPIIIIAFITEIVVTTQKYLSASHNYIIWSIMAFLILPITYFWYITTAISPTDSIQLQHLVKIQHPQKSKFEPQKHKYFCNLCKTCIGHKSFHCNKCHRCVEYFDHHCKWLNNCIGAKNYFEFIQLVVLSQLFMVFFYVVNGIVIVQIYNQEQNLPALFWITVGTIVFSVVPFFAISTLIFLHMYLIIAKRATIDLILQNRKKNKIHPQNTNDNLTQKKETNYTVTPIPEESPITSPCFFQRQHSILRQLSINRKSHESLKKFVTNLANNLRNSKKQEQEHQLTKDSIIGKKITFKPTILKKSTSFGKFQLKSNTLIKKSSKQPSSQQHQQQKSPSSKQNQDLKNQFNLSEEGYDTGKNLITKLRFSTKNQIIDQSSQAKTPRQNHLKEMKSQTERPEYNQRRNNNPKRLEPLTKNHTQRKIRFMNQIQIFNNKQNVNLIKDMPRLNFGQINSYSNTEIMVQNSEKHSQVKRKPPTTRIFQIICSNEEANNGGQES